MRLAHDHRWLAVLGSVVLLAAVVGTLGTSGGRHSAGTRVWVSSPTDPTRRLLSLPSDAAAPVTARVRVDPGDRRQVWRGTGAALTDASVELLTAAPDGARRLFAPSAADGARLSWVRLPLTATDMSSQAWTWGWDGVTASPSRQARAAATLVAGLAERSPDLRVVATPWTAPAWMKQPAGVRGGALRDDAVVQYAGLLVAQADELRRLGVPVAAMTLGNEPGHSADYPSMTMSATQQQRLGRLVAPRLHERGIELWAVDHNWVDPPRYDEVLAGAPGAFDAAAFHCYAGRPDQMAGLPVAPIVTECTGTTSSWGEAFAWDARHLVDESIAAGSTGLMTWNLAVDPRGGPRDLASGEGCSSCRGLLTVAGRTVTPGPEFYVLAQLGRAADPGARVLGSRASRGVQAAAFGNEDGSIGVVAFNSTGREQVLAVEVAGEPAVRRVVRAGELVTVRRRR